MIEWFFCDENSDLNLFSVITIGSPAYGVVYETEPSFIERSVQRKYFLTLSCSCLVSVTVDKEVFLLILKESVL